MSTDAAPAGTAAVPGETPSQTVGPYLHIGLPWPEGPFAVSPETPGAIRLRGIVRDGAGDPIPDALVESWQADPDGGFAHVARRPDATDHHQRPFPSFRGFGRSATDADGRFAIVTLKPGPVPWPSDLPADGPPPIRQAPHVDLSIFARGLLHRVVTRCYFGDEPAANERDPVLRAIDPARRETLIATPTADGYRLDIHLQGPDETVFFAL